MANRPEHKFLPVTHCASCGQDHPSVEFHPFTNRSRAEGDWDWWGSCPTTGAPIPGAVEPAQPGKTVLGGTEKK